MDKSEALKLVDAYVADELAGDQLDEFEYWIISSIEVYEEVAFATALKNNVSEVLGESARDTAELATVRNGHNSGWVIAAAAIAASVLFVAILGPSQRFLSGEREAREFNSIELSQSRSVSAEVLTIEIDKQDRLELKFDLPLASYYPGNPVQLDWINPQGVSERYVVLAEQNGEFVSYVNVAEHGIYRVVLRATQDNKVLLKQQIDVIKRE